MTKSTGEIIRALRVQRGMSVEQLAEKIGKSRTTVWRYENGNIEEMPYTILIPIAKALNVSPTVLLGIDEENYSSLLDNLNEYIKDNLFAEYEIEELIDYAKWIVNKRSR